MKNIFLLVLLFSYTVHSQETLLSIDTNNTSIKEVLPIVNEYNNDFSLMFVSRRVISSYLFDKDFKRIDSLVTDKRPGKYKTTIGSSIAKNNDYRVYLSNSNKTKFATINFSFKNKKASFSEFELLAYDNEEDDDDDDDYEFFLQSINNDNKFYLVTTETNNSVINIYAFDDDANYKKHRIDLSKYELLGKKHAKTFNQLLYKTAFEKMDLNKFDNKSINSLEQTSDYVKMYVRDNHLVFSIDKNHEFTQIIDIDLANYQHSYKRIDKVIGFKAKTSNSYLFKDQIFQAAATSKKMYFIVRDLETKTVLAEYTIQENEPISFKNSLIIQNGGAYIKKRTLKKTQQYLRKVASSNIGITVDSKDKNYYITLGGVKEIKQGGGMPMMGMPMGMPIASLGALTVSFNPTMYALGSYTSTRSVTIKTILSTDFKHLEGEVPDNAFDVIRQYQEDNEYPSKGETVFRYKDYYILGHLKTVNEKGEDDYYRTKKKYFLFKFK